MNAITSKAFVGTLLEVLMETQEIKVVDFCKEYRVSSKTLVRIKKTTI